MKDEEQTYLKQSTGSKRLTNNSNINSNNILRNEQIAKTITLSGEKVYVNKKVTEAQVKLEKKWITETKKIEVPVKYEQIYVNGKELDSHTESEVLEVFSKVKDKISDIFLHQKNEDEENTKEHKEPQSSDIIITRLEPNQHKVSEIDPQEKLVPLSIDKNNNKKEENEITIWGEEIVIDKRMVKLGKIIIKKYEAQEKQNIDTEIRAEKLVINYPDNRREEIT